MTQMYQLIGWKLHGDTKQYNATTVTNDSATPYFNPTKGTNN